MTDDLAPLRALHEHVWKVYKGEIYDWCGHNLAVDITARKTGVEREEVRRIIGRRDNGTFL